MSIYDQLLLDTHDEQIGDLFAGGGGASCGIEMATGRLVDFAINHDPAAVALHEANHPGTTHYTADVFEVDPREVAGGRPVGLLWASPDCTFHSKARGGKPMRSKDQRRRALAWVVTRWAGTVRPRVIILENVEEFADWCPLVAKRGKNGRVKKAGGGTAAPGERVPVEDQQLVPDPDRAGHRFDAWVRSLEDHGYRVEWRELRACDFGAPTIRKRLFLVARCDGEPIVWPEPTHGEAKGLKPYRTAAECIDWSEPMCSIFATPEEAREWGRAHEGKGTPRRPLAENTMRRIARGVMLYVVEAGEPFIVGVGGRMGQSPGRPLDRPFQTITAKGDAALVAPTLIQSGYGERKGQAPRTLDLEEPLGTIVGGGSKHALVAAFLARHWGGMTGKDLREPHPTILTKGAQDQLVAAHIQRDFGQSIGHGADEPLGTVTPGGGGKAALVTAFIQKYYGQGVGSELDEPAPTVTTKDRMGLVTVEVAGEPFIITDIAMRMLQPRELYRAQGFPDSYRITTSFFDPDRGKERDFTKTEQVRMVGNSVCPPQAAALVAANCPELVARDEAKGWAA